MSKERAYNFSAGPSMLPLEVIEDVAANLTNYHDCGESVLEMSHRSAEFKAILEDAEKNLRDIMNIPDNYKVMFIQGGGTLQFAMVAMNLLRNSGKADYVLTGTWAKKAYKEAQKFGDIKVVASSEDSTFSYIPEVKKEDFRPDADYVHITLNNTIYGTHYPYTPDTGDIPLVADMSSCILSEEVDVTKYGLIYAGVQKNIAPSGIAIAIMREDLIGFDQKCLIKPRKITKDIADRKIVGTRTGKKPGNGKTEGKGRQVLSGRAKGMAGQTGGRRPKPKQGGRKK